MWPAACASHAPNPLPAGIELKITAMMGMTMTVGIVAFVAISGGRQFASSPGLIDSFVFGSPLGVVGRRAGWCRDGTAFGPICGQIGIAMSEVLLGFAGGVSAGVVAKALSIKREYVDALTEDKGQFLPGGMMPADGPQRVLEVERLAGKVNKPVDLAATRATAFAVAADKPAGFAR